MEAAGVYVHPRALVESDDIGPNTRIWAFAHVMPNVHVGAGCNICEHAFLESGCAVGNNVTIKNGVAVWQGVTLEDDVFLGPNCVFTNDRNPRAYIKKVPDSLLATVVHANATIGANSTILCNLEIGKYAFIGAGAVVLRSVPNFALVVGNPARQIGWMCACANRLPFPPAIDAAVPFSCSNCGIRFLQVPEGIRIMDDTKGDNQ